MACISMVNSNGLLAHWSYAPLFKPLRNDDGSLVLTVVIKSV